MKRGVLAIILLSCRGPDGEKALLVRVEPAMDTVMVGDTARFRAWAISEAGDTLSEGFLWSTPDTQVALPLGDGAYRALGPGVARVVASLDEASDTAILQVVSSEPELWVKGWVFGDTLLLLARLGDSLGQWAKGARVLLVAGDTLLDTLTGEEPLAAGPLGLSPGESFYLRVSWGASWGELTTYSFPCNPAITSPNEGDTVAGDVFLEWTWDSAPPYQEALSAPDWPGEPCLVQALNPGQVSTTLPGDVLPTGNCVVGVAGGTYKEMAGAGLAGGRVVAGGFAGVNIYHENE